MSNDTKPGLFIFQDALGRLILGQKQNETETTVGVTNPVVLHTVDAGNGRASIQLLPIFFREFLADKTGDSVFTYNKCQITLSDIDAIDFRLEGQYRQMFAQENQFVAPQPTAPSPAKEPVPAVINLFDS